MTSDNPVSSQSSPRSWKEVVNRKLESATKEAVQRGQQYECQIRALETKLASDLNNSRAIHNLLAEALSSLDSNHQRVDKALTRHIPHIFKELKESMESLRYLEEHLPEVRTQVKTVRAVYDSGRATASDLTEDLQWKHASLQDKCRRIVFTRTSPVSAPEVAALRLAFCLVFALFAWQLGGALDGAYRAYRHRLMWGDKLMS